MLKEVPAILVDIVRNFLGLTNDQVWQYDGLKILPNDRSLWAVVHYLTSKPYSTTSQFEVDNTDPDHPLGKETTFVQTEEFYRIEVASAISRNAQSTIPLVAAAMSASYSQMQQAIYNFRIFPVSESFINVSRIDGGAIINRFMIEVRVMASYSITKTVDYYDSFPYTLSPNP